MEKFITVEQLREWLRGGPDFIPIDELNAILGIMPDARLCGHRTNVSESKTNFEWLVENDRLLQFLKDIVLTECADGVKFERVFTKKWGIEVEWGETVWNIFAKWLVSPHEEKNIFDVEEIHKNCTVRILRNSATGEERMGWWKNEKEVD